MNAVEKNIVASMKKYPYEPRDVDVDKLCAIPLGQLSEDFCRNINIGLNSEKNQKLHLRLALEEYILQPSDFLLERVKKILKKLPAPLRSPIHPELQVKAAGTYLRPISDDLVQNIYLLEDPNLIELFQKQFPTPSAQFFDRTQVPSAIQTRTNEITETIKTIYSKTLESFILKKQRATRANRRYKEELNRITLRDSEYLQSSQMSAEDLIKDANTPYKPKCAPELSKRIIAAASQVSAFSTVKHITSQTALQSILDDALYGRRNLLDFYLRFDPAALNVNDVLNGDGNVICLGPQEIDPIASGDLVIEFDLPKLIQKKASAFYKQRDLEYYPNSRVRQVQLGDTTLFFDHTAYSYSADQRKTHLKIFDARESRGYGRSSSAQKSSFIAYDLEHMHEILTLNFFRFMDEMKNINGEHDQLYIDSFYQKVNQLTDEELVIFLTSLEKNMTDTAEFNFYGAHQIDFTTVINISQKKQEYTLHFPTLISALRQGNIEELRIARLKIPELFQSYRFLDYLLLEMQGSASDAQYYLDDLRKQCHTPEWIQYTPLSIPEEFEMCWDPHPDTLKQEKVRFVIHEFKSLGNRSINNTEIIELLKDLSEEVQSLVMARITEDADLVVFLRCIELDTRRKFFRQLSDEQQCKLVDIYGQFLPLIQDHLLKEAFEKVSNRQGVAVFRSLTRLQQELLIRETGVENLEQRLMNDSNVFRSTEGRLMWLAALPSDEDRIKFLETCKSYILRDTSNKDKYVELFQDPDNASKIIAALDETSTYDLSSRQRS